MVDGLDDAAVVTGGLVDVFDIEVVVLDAGELEQAVVSAGFVEAQVAERGALARPVVVGGADVGIGRAAATAVVVLVLAVLLGHGLRWTWRRIETRRAQPGGRNCGWGWIAIFHVSTCAVKSRLLPR